MEKKIKLFIISILIIIIALIVIILKSYKNLEIDNEILENGPIDGESFEITITNNLEKVDNKNEFYNVENSINNYIEYINSDNYEAILKVLDNNYIKDNNISIEYLEKENKKYSGNKFFCKELDKIEYNLNIVVYFARGYVGNEDYSKFEEKYFAIVVDNSKDLFSIIPEKLEKEINYKFNLKLQIDSDYNKIVYKIYEDGEIIQKYFNFYRGLILNKIDIAYDLLDEEYKKVKFSSEKNFEEYIKNKKSNFESATIIKYSKQNYKDYDEYTIVDNFNNYYIIKEKGVMDFSILLDNYTIQTEEYKSEYMKAEDELKVVTNVDKIFKMLNNKDYENIYHNYLNKTFRDSYFLNYDKFKEYIIQNFFDFNYQGAVKINKEANYYIINVNYKEGLTSASEEKNVNIIMVLKENEDFEFSFEIK